MANYEYDIRIIGGVQILGPVTWMNEPGIIAYEIHYFHAQKAHTQ